MSAHRPASACIGDGVTPVQDRVVCREHPGVPALGLEHIGQQTLDITQWASAEDFGARGMRFEAGDVLMGRLRPGFRKLVLADRAGICTPEAWVLRPKRGIDPHFALYRLAAADVIDTAVASSAGSRMPRARWTAVGEMPVCWPSLEDQRRLAELPRALDAQRASERVAVAAALALARAFLRAAPSTRRTVGSLAHCPKRGGVWDRVDAPYISVGDLEAGRLAVERWGEAKDYTSAQQWVERGDILFSRIRPALRKVALCPVDGRSTPELLAIRAHDPADCGTLAVVLSSEETVARAIAVATGTRMPRLDWGRLARIEVDWPLPSAPLRDAMNAVMEHVLASVDLRRTAARLRDQAIAHHLQPAARV